MSVKLSRYVFRRIHGRIIPIRVGSEAAVKAAEAGKGISGSAVRRLKLAMSRSNLSIGKTGKLREMVNHSGTDVMEAFMRKSGAVRFSAQDNSVVFSFARKLTEMQKNALAKFSAHADTIVAGFHPKKGTQTFVGAMENDKAFNSIREFFRSPLSKAGGIEALKGKGINTVTAAKLEKKAIAHFGTTRNPFEAGYITRSGEALDLSGRTLGAGRDAIGKRFMDHREVGSFMSLPAWKAPTSKSLQYTMRQAQLARKGMAARLHEMTTLKRDLAIIKKDPTLKEAFNRMTERFNVLAAQKRLKQLRKKP